MHTHFLLHDFMAVILHVLQRASQQTQNLEMEKIQQNSCTWKEQSRVGIAQILFFTLTTRHVVMRVMISHE